MTDGQPSGQPEKQSGNRLQTFTLAKCAMLCALLIVSCFVTIPLGPVPFTLQTAVMVAIVLVCGPREVALITGAYLLMGTVGLPVFSGMTGGILRASTGFLAGFFIGGVAASALRRTIAKVAKRTLVADIFAAVAFLIIDFALGWAWYVYFGGVTLSAAFAVMVVPFLVPDVLKAAAAIAVAREVRKRVPRLSE